MLTSQDNVRVWHGSASLLYQATQRVGGFVEVFTLAPTSSADNRAMTYGDTGLYIYATPNVQFDVRYGVRLGDRVGEFFTGAGLSVRY